MIKKLFAALKRFWTHSIRRQLILGIALVHAVLMTIFVLDLVSRQHNFLHEQAVSRTYSLAEILAASSTTWVLANDVIGLEEVINSQSAHPDLVYAMVLSIDGKVLGHTDNQNVGKYASDSVSLGLLSSAGATQALIDNKNLIDVAAPIRANDAIIGWARVAVNQDANIAGLKVITRDGVLYTLVAISVGVLFAYFMAAGLTGGLRQLVEVADGIRSGQRLIRSKMDRVDELGQLSVDFNLMLDHLLANEQELDEARQALQESEERFNLAMQGSNDGLWDWDANTNRVHYSTRWKQMLGYKEEEIGDMETEWSSRVHPKDLTQAQEKIDSHLAGETPLYESIHRMLHKDGRYRWHLERGIAVRGDDGVAYRMVGTNTDITERKQVEDALYEEKERALITLNSIGDAVITTDDVGTVTSMNPVAEELTGWKNDEAVGRPLREIFFIINEETRQPCENPVTYCLSQGKIIGLANQTVLVNRVGLEIAIEDSAAPIRDKSGRIIGVIMVFHDVTVAREMANKMTWQATHDSLTSLANRMEFEHRLEDLLQSSIKRHKTHALMYIDLDQFKVVNDTCGHVAGDELLRQLSFLLQNNVRESDVLARLGGDEFGVLLPGCPMERALDIANDLRKVIKEFRFSWEGKSFEIGASIGLVKVSEESDTISNILSAADVACYAAKDLGRNRVHVYEPHDEELARRRGEMQWISRIQDALKEDRFALYCQVIRAIELEGGDAAHFEILVRLIDEDGSIISPAAFIPAAERYNLMPDIDRWVIRNSLKYIDEYYTSADDSNISIAINLSGNSLSDDSFLSFVKGELGRYTLPEGAVCFEITETSAIANLPDAIKLIRALKEVGCQFALDDFGSGLSSFAYLKNLPVDYLKIDGSFVKDIKDDPIDFAMVDSINEIGHVMGIKTIAEFVEDERTLELLRDMKVDYAQGYGIGMPIPIDEQFVLSKKRTAS